MQSERGSRTARSEFAQALDDAIAARPLSLRSLQRLLSERGSPVSVSTLSYWRSGARHPEGPGSTTAVEELERLLLLSPRTLTDLIGSSRRAGQTGRLGAAFADDREQLLHEVIEELSADPQEALREIWASVVATVGTAQATVTAFRCRSLLQATTGIVRSIPIVIPLPDDADQLPVVSAVGGGSIGSSFVHPSRRMIGARFDLQTAVTAPETAMVEFEVGYPASYPTDREIGYGTKRRAREISIWAQFDPDATPDWICEFEDTVDGPVEFSRRPWAGASAHARRFAWGPGYFGLRWGRNPRHGAEDSSTDPVPRP